MEVQKIWLREVNGAGNVKVIGWFEFRAKKWYSSIPPGEQTDPSSTQHFQSPSKHLLYLHKLFVNKGDFSMLQLNHYKLFMNAYP